MTRSFLVCSALVGMLALSGSALAEKTYPTARATAVNGAIKYMNRAWVAKDVAKLVNKNGAAKLQLTASKLTATSRAGFIKGTRDWSVGTRQKVLGRPLVYATVGVREVQPGKYVVDSVRGVGTWTLQGVTGLVDYLAPRR